MRRLRIVVLVAAAGLLALGCGPDARPKPRATRKPPVTAKKPPRPPHALHEHGHLHPHPFGDHHHHPHPHPHLEGQGGHHHPY